jgi:WD40 repeat protein
MAPEQARGRAVDHRADLFSLGCVLYRMSTGEVPFKGSDMLSTLSALALDEPAAPHELNPEVSPGLSRLVMQLLTKEPVERPPSAQAVVEAIMAIELGRNTIRPSGPVHRQRQAAVQSEWSEPTALLKPASAGLPPRTPRPAGTGSRKPLVSPGLLLGLGGALALLLGLLGLAAYLLGPAVYRIATDEGEFVVEIDDPQVEAVLTQQGIVMHDRASDRKYTLKPGRQDVKAGHYDIEVSEAGGGLHFSTKEFTIRRGEKVSVKVTLAPARVAKQSSPEDKVGEVRRFVGHEGWGIRSAAFTPDGRQALSSDAAGNVILWDVASGKDVRRLVGHQGEVPGVAVSVDGRRAATCGVDNTVRLWDLKTGQEIHIFKGSEGTIEGVAISPDGRRVVSSSGDGLIRLWDTETGKELRNWQAHAVAIRAVAFTPDGNRAISVSRDQTVRLWEVDTGKQIKSFEGHQGWVTGLAISRDGSRIATASVDRTVRVWDVKTGKEGSRFEGHGATVDGVAFLPDGRHVLSVGGDKMVRLWDAETAKELHHFEGHTEGLAAVAVSPDGHYALSGGGDLILRLWRLPDLLPTESAKAAEIRRHEWQDKEQGIPANIYRTLFSPDGRLYLGCGDAGPKGAIRLWDTATGNQVRELLTGKDVWFSGAAFTPDGKQILSWYSKDNNLYMWDVATGKEIRQFEGHTGPILDGNMGERGGSISPDGKRILSGSEDKTLRLWDLATGKELHKLEGHTETCFGVFSPDGKQVLSFGDKTLRLWDAETGKELAKLEGHTENCAGRFSPDGKQVLSYSANKTVRLWDAATGKQVHALEGPTDAVWNAFFLPGGKEIVAWGKDKVLRVWDAASGKLVRNLDLGDNWNSNATISPDGRRLLTAHGDGTVRLRDLATGDDLHRFENAPQAAGFSFSPDGRFAVAGSFRAGLYLWRLPGELRPQDKVGELRPERVGGGK